MERLDPVFWIFKFLDVIGISAFRAAHIFLRINIISIIIGDLKTWPSDVIDFLESKFEMFLGWKCMCPRRAYAYQYDSTIYAVRDILKSHSLVGYHCTKLTANEVEQIFANGMCLQNSTSLSKRIASLVESEVLSADVAQRLIDKNQADEYNRANMLWFCFFEPHLAGRSGIERFFQSWGGEALYNYHEGDPVTGKALLNIGTPCIVKAEIPISSLEGSYYPDSSMIGAFLLQCGHKLENRIEHEGFSTKNIDSKNIVKIVEHPSDQFIKLTKCDEWVASGIAL